MDFNEWKAHNNEKYGTADEDWDYLKKTTIITFNYDDRGNVSGKHGRYPVFRDKKFENTILAGETWICSLNSNHLDKGYYFATPVQKIDSSFMFELKKDHMSEIAHYLWEKNRSTIEPLLEEKFKEQTIQTIAKAVEDTKAEYEIKIRELENKINELELRDAQNKQIISSLEEKAKRSPTNGNGRGATQQFTGLLPDTSVRRIAPDSISSPFFFNSRYFVHISADHKVMEIKPHVEGQVVAMDNIIILNGLNSMTSFTEPYDMVSEYDPSVGGVRVYLK